LKDFRRLGVNRISFGIQSSDEEELNLLGRIHTHEDTVKSIHAARNAGFNNLNLDLIFNLPGQTMERWRKNLQTALALDPEHLSLYSLTIEEGTLLNQQIIEGLYDYPDDDDAATMMQIAIDTLKQAGYIHYEISNWAKPSYECRHNKQYWKNLPYFGFGAGAHGLVSNIRTVNEPLPGKYIQHCTQKEVKQYPIGPAAIESHQRDRKEQIEDHMILNLRLIQEGINLEEFQHQYNKRVEDFYPDQVTNLIESGHLEWCNDGKNFRIPSKHFFIANQILVNFMRDQD
jgi:oxygen-independent coproporphyrinogen-3 oxidase